MNNNWILILGASSDIAIATAHKYAQNGYSIYLCSRNIEELKKEAKNIEIQTKADEVYHTTNTNYGEELIQTDTVLDPIIDMVYKTNDLLAKLPGNH